MGEQAFRFISIAAQKRQGDGTAMKKSPRLSSKFSRRQLSMEGLENRYALSGMVSAVMQGGDLVIEGDAGNNHVFISQGPLAGQVIISGGQDDALDPLTATQINGGATAVTLDGFTGDLNVTLLDGDDRVVVSDINLPGFAQVSLGTGNDTLSLQSRASSSVEFSENGGAALTYGAVSVAESVFVTGSAGDDVVALFDVAVTNDVVVYGGAGNDTFLQDGATLAENSIGDQLLLNMSTGDDTTSMTRLNVGRVTVIDPIADTGTTVTLTNVHVTRDIDLYLSINADTVQIKGEDTGANAFTAENVNLHTGDGDDLVTVENANVGSLVVYTGEGNEGDGFYGVQLLNINAQHDLLVDTAGGLDNVLLQAIIAGSLTANTGTGSGGLIVQNTTAVDAVFSTGSDGDAMGLYDSSFEELSAELAAGDDAMYLSNVSSSTSATIDGGDDTNSYFDLGGLSLTGLTRVSI